MDVVIKFSEDEWTRVAEALLVHNVPPEPEDHAAVRPSLTAEDVATWLRGTMRNVVRRYEDNRAYDLMKRAEATRLANDTW